MPLDVIDDGTATWRRAGGTAGNVAAMLAFLGWHTKPAGRLGDDVAGQALVSDLRGAGVDTSLLQVDAGAATNRLVHEIRRGEHRYRFTCPRCGQPLPRSRPLRLDQVEPIVAAVPNPDVYFFDRANPGTVLLAERYAARGTTVVFEPSTPANATLIQRAMRAATIVKGSHEHGPELVEHYESGQDGQLRIITQGAAGARFRLGTGRWHHVGVFAVDVVDAAGAGDWTTSGMLDSLIGKRSLAASDVGEAVMYGHALAALNCALPGARGLAESRDATTVAKLVRALQEGDEVEPLSAPPMVSSTVAHDLCDWCLLHVDHVVPDRLTASR
ncbi:carbohydrate kinase family protein [Baekduia sp.]|uniref:carbohydrate kinase family protein n=1 Tax=Baekduia sp. TaxID=2600305 RepID=UPI002E09F8D2|nr:PfkB family carbohydrate kinase [Baekduia sp.]